ncbi:CASP-like protein 1E1 [Cocos nucifera]|uniref:CASP-like protein n=1 Tax=Cocos nucifera TaxID=13894 RepID=A0A8K0MUD2_COCNU|nr:CASP-like protein 1E1 [Cocos nucifera]
MEGASPHVDGIQAARTQGYNIGPSPSRSMQLPGYILRIVAMVLTFVSAIVMGVAKEAVTVIEMSDSGQTTFTGSIKSRYSSALVYFIVVNAIVLVYSIISLALAILNRGDPRRMAMHLSIADLVMVVLLFSSNGAAAAISVVADKGLPRYAWPKICYALHQFCGHIKAAIVLSMFASLAYLLLVLVWIMDLHMRS